MKRVILLLLLLSLIPFVSATPHTKTIYVVNDTHVRSSTPTTNYASEEYAFLDSDPGSEFVIGMMAFNNSTIPYQANVSNASINYVGMTYINGVDTGINLSRITSVWTASTVTYNTAPTINNAENISIIFNYWPEQWISMNVTGWAQRWTDGTVGNYGIELYQNNTVSTIPLIYFNESSYKPYWTVTYNNTPITLTDVSSTYSLTAGQTLSIDANFTGYDSDETPVFSRNFTKGTFDTYSGIMSWPTIVGDAGTYNWQIGVDDGFGSVNYTNFTVTVNAQAPSAGVINITVRDEQFNHTLIGFTGTASNSTYSNLKNPLTNTTNYVTWTSSEVGSGTYLVTITPNSSYSPRMVLVQSPYNGTIYLPNSINNTIDLINFYIIDYTGRFTWSNSRMIITKNSSTMVSNYFDADSKVQAYLIRGDSYTITILNSVTGDIQNWGNYVPSGSGSVNIVVSDLGFNTTKYEPFIYNVSINPTNFSLKWTDRSTVLNSIKFTVKKGSSIVYYVESTARYGMSEYTITNFSDIYIINATIDTTFGQKTFFKTVDYRTAESKYGGIGFGSWAFGSYTTPAWLMNAICLIILMLLGGSFGFISRGEGSIITGIVALVMYNFGWLTLGMTGIGFLGSVVFLIIIYHLQEKRKG